jgi:hypothetical protein
MNRRLIFLLIFILPLVLAACSNDTTLNFHNATQCGPATIKITDSKTGFTRDYSVDEGQDVKAKVTPNVDLHYEVTYDRQSDLTVCDAKKGTLRLTKGQTVNVRLENVVDPALEQSQTQTPDVTPTAAQ